MDAQECITQLTVYHISTAALTTKFMDQNLSGEAEGFSVRQEIIRSFWKTKIYYRNHCSLPLDAVLVRLNSIQNVTTYFFSIFVYVYA
jgi:hypothetical protein